MTAKFGPAGNSDSFRAMGYRKTEQVPEYIRRMGLDAYEYQCGRGVRISLEVAQQLGQLAARQGVTLSLHAPYYISLSGIEEQKRLASIDYILQSARAADAMGAQRVVVHSGSCAKISRQQALQLATDTLQRALRQMDEEGLGHIHLCPETMGKLNQLGDLEEVLTLCTLDERLIPCIDFGHLNARSFGALCQPKGMEPIFEHMEQLLGNERMRSFHAHFSKIEYTQPGGEKRHLTFADTVFGPSFEPLAELLCKKNALPTIICESAGTQAEDALWMKEFYQDCLRQQGGKSE